MKSNFVQKPIDLASNDTFRCIVVVSCLLALQLFLQYRSLGWWFGLIDAPVILMQAILFSPLEYFFSPPDYQFLTTANLTPWVTLSWEFDYSIFELNPVGFWAHQLVSSAVLLAIIYALLYRLTGSMLNSAIFSLAIIVSPAYLEVADALITRHYLEGMVFLLLSLHCAIGYESSNNRYLLLLSVILYALSITAKEIYVPLPGLLIFLFSGTLKQLVLKMTPYAVVALAYLIWRIHMLGGGAGGYSSVNSILQTLGSPEIYYQVSALAFASLHVNKVIAIILLLLTVWLFLFNLRHLSRRHLAGAIVSLVIIAAPLLTLLPLISVGTISSRWLYLPVIVIFIYLAYLLSVTSSKLLSRAALLIVTASVVVGLYDRVVDGSRPLLNNKAMTPSILEADERSYVNLGSYNRLLSAAGGHWVNLSRLHSGKWGTLVISDIQQTRYHDMDKRKRALWGKELEYSDTLIQGESNAMLDLLRSYEFSEGENSLKLEFLDRIGDDRVCWVYVFGKANGVLYSLQDCKQWTISLDVLTLNLRRIGYDIDEVDIALWTDRKEIPYFSKPYRLSAFLPGIVN